MHFFLAKKKMMTKCQHSSLNKISVCLKEEKYER